MLIVDHHKECKEAKEWLETEIKKDYMEDVMYLSKPSIRNHLESKSKLKYLI